MHGGTYSRSKRISPSRPDLSVQFLLQPYAHIPPPKAHRKDGTLPLTLLQLPNTIPHYIQVGLSQNTVGACSYSAVKPQKLTGSTTFSQNTHARLSSISIFTVELDVQTISKAPATRVVRKYQTRSQITLQTSCYDLHRNRKRKSFLLRALPQGVLGRVRSLDVPGYEVPEYDQHNQVSYPATP